MIQRFKALLGRKAHAPMADGIYVSAQGALEVKGDLARMALHTGARHTIQMSSAAGGISVSVSSLPGQGEEFKWNKEFPLVQASQANELFHSTVQAWHDTLFAAVGAPRVSSAGAGGHRWPIFMVGVLVGAVLLTSFGLMSSPSGTSAVAAQVAPVVAVAPAARVAGPAPAAPAGPVDANEAARRLQQARLGEQERERVAKAHRIQVRAGGSPLVAFSDPNCPACQDLEKEASSLKQGVGFSVIPVAFQPGSRVLVAKVLCASDPVRAWGQALKGVNPPGDACEAGLRKVDENNALFASIGASATPTLVAGNGQMAQGSAQAQQLELFASTYAN